MFLKKNYRILLIEIENTKDTVAGAIEVRCEKTRTTKD